MVLWDKMGFNAFNGILRYFGGGLGKSGMDEEGMIGMVQGIEVGLLGIWMGDEGY
jgi:hypothetical protein